MRAFVDEFKPGRETKILDVGGTTTNWDLVDIGSSVVLLNLVVPEGAEERPNITWEQGDGCSLPYSDGEFDICFSNSTIEHLHTLDRQKLFAAEMRRVGRSYFVQTPARSFPFEVRVSLARLLRALASAAGAAVVRAVLHALRTQVQARSGAGRESARRAPTALVP
jgi:hypothetical protein